MAYHNIPDPESLRREILASHKRSREYGIDPINTRGQVHLSPEELAQRREENRVFLEVATAQIKELYRFVAGAGFAVSIIDKDGYMLETIGDRAVLQVMEPLNFLPGYRWTERDVGTTAGGIALERKIAVQVNDDEHFCKRGFGWTCSASPIFGDNGEMIGVITMSGESRQVHPHTLGMVITAAKAIENQLRIIKTSQELLLQNNYMNAIIESIVDGVMSVDRTGVITHINDQGKRILQWGEDPVGKPLSEVLGSESDWKQLLHAGSGYVDREVFIRGPSRVIHLIQTAKPILDSEGKVQGIIFVFNEIKRIRKLVSKMAGSQARFTFNDIIGVSPGIKEAKRLAMTAAAGRSTVLLLGETGTGKELFAQAIHNRSERRGHPFVAINCGAIPRELLESELFGYVEGAFTGARKGGRPGKFELASGGTVFLDEIGDMSADMQVKLLRVLETGEVYRIGEHKPISVDLRIIAATHLDLKQAVDRGDFREDLFYRLNVFPIVIPPLRERPEDILLLARHFLKHCRKVLGKPEVKFSPDAEEVLRNYHWPGNVRELENVVERAINLVDADLIEPVHLGPLTLRKNLVLSGYRGSLLEEMERQTIKEVMERMGYNVSRSAKMLGITRATLYNKLKKYNFSFCREHV